MQKRAFLYVVKHMSRQSRLSGISFGVIHADNEEQATLLLNQQMGDNAYSFKLRDATTLNCNGYIGIPSGELLAFDQNK